MEGKNCFTRSQNPIKIEDICYDFSRFNAIENPISREIYFMSVLRNCYTLGKRFINYKINNKRVC